MFKRTITVLLVKGTMLHNRLLCINESLYLLNKNSSFPPSHQALPSNHHPTLFDLDYFAALLTIAKIQKQLKCPLMGEHLKKMLLYIYTME